MRILVLVPVIFATTLMAQTFAPIGATWTYTYAVDIDPFPPVYSSYPISVIGESMVGGYLCSEVQGGSLACHPNQGYVRQSADSVFYWDQFNFAFSLLYRWDALPGESWQVIHTGPLYQDTLTYTVISIGTTMVNSQVRRTLDVQLTDQMGFAFTGGQLIEGIGDLGYLFPWYIALCDGFTMGPLRCYEDSIVGLYMRPGIVDCELGTGMNEITNASDPVVAPSLADIGQLITVTSTDPPIQRIDVLDAMGRRVVSPVLVNGTAEVRLFTAGSYTVLSYVGNGLHVQRLMVR